MRRLGLGQRIRGSRFLRDSATLQVAAAFNNLGNLASTFALAHVLGATRQGEFYLAIATYSFVWFTVNLGLYAVTTSQVAAAAARGNEYKVAIWLAYLTKASVVIGVLVAVAAWATLPAFADRVYGSRDVGVYAAVLALTPLVELPRAVACAALQGTRRMLPLAKVENAQEIVRVFLVVSGALLTGDALGPSVGMVLSAGVGSILALDAYRRESRGSTTPLPSLREIRRRLFEVPILYGFPLGLRMGFVRNVNVYGVQILPSIILGVFGDAAWVAYLRLAQRLVDVARTFMQGISRTALPYLSELIGLEDVRRLSRAYWRATLLSGLLISCGVLLSIPVAPYLIDLFPREYHEPVRTVFLILVPGVLIVSFSVANDTFYLVTNTFRVALRIGIVVFVVNTSVVTALAWKFPTVGAAWGVTFTLSTSLVHIVYAAWWFRGRTRPPRPVSVRAA